MLAEFDVYALAHVDAGLNLLALILTVAGLVAIKRGNVELHKKLMLAATAVSAAFLCCYLTYHALKPAPVTYKGEGVGRAVYLTILLSHIVLAVVVVPLILRTVYLGLADRREQHRRWARWTAPIWLYVSATGVIVWAILYPGGGGTTGG